MSELAPESVRLDIWLWRARFIKTRKEAGAFVSNGRVRLTRFGTQNRVSKPHYAVKTGDELLFVRSGHIQNIRIINLGTRRGPATEAQALYHILPTQDA